MDTSSHIESAHRALQNAERSEAAAKAAHGALCDKLAAIEKTKRACGGPVEKLVAIIDDEDKALKAVRAARAEIRDAESAVVKARRRYERAVGDARYAEIDARAKAFAELFAREYPLFAEEIIAAAGANRSLVAEASVLNRRAPAGVDRLRMRGRLVHPDFLSRLRLTKFAGDMGGHYWFPAWGAECLPGAQTVLEKPTADPASWEAARGALARAEARQTSRYIAAAKAIAALLAENHRIVRDVEKYNARHVAPKAMTPCSLMAGRWYDFGEKIALPSADDRHAWLWNTSKPEGVGQ